MGKNELKKASPEDIKIFLEGKDGETSITSIELNQSQDWSVDETNKVYITTDDPVKGKSIKSNKFIPFAWTRSLKGSGFYGDDSQRIKIAAKKYKITTEKLITGDNERLEDGFKYLVKTSGTYRDLVNFFKNGGIDPWNKKDKYGKPIKPMVMILSPIEQFLIQSGKRLFKGIEDYTEVHKVVFDIETTSLEPHQGHIFLIGIKDNRGFRTILDSYDENGEYSEEMEMRMIMKFFDILRDLKPSIITGYNSENFDWYYILGRCELLGLDIKEIATTNHPNIPIQRKNSTLKMGGEMENYQQTLWWGTNVLDTYHRVRQAQALNSNIKSAKLKYIAQQSKVERPNRVYIEGSTLGRMWVENKQFNYNPTTGQWYGLDERKPELKDVTNAEDRWEVVNGKFLITEYLTDDLLETELVDNIYTQAGFLTAKLIPTVFMKSITMGTASIWKLLMLGWSYENGIAIPDVTEKRDFVGGLSRLLSVGYAKNIVKFDFASLYPSIQITHDVFPGCDISDAIKSMLIYFYDTRNVYKKLMVECQESGDEKGAVLYDRKQLPIKIFNNTSFGSVSAPHIFNWGDSDVGEMITCTGRQYLRQMIRFFISKGYKPLVLDTDGVNFSYDESINNNTYVGKGLHRFVKGGKIYTGIEAGVAEYNERFMMGVMGLDIDYVMPATINLSRKNYATMDAKGKIKLTGNSIKSKTIPQYIEKCLDESFKFLLNGDGKGFVNYYYSYIEKLYNKDIPLLELAMKSKVKRSLKEYKNRGVNKNGNALPKQAHMELIIKEGIHVNLGDTIYYVNNGTKKSQGDVVTKKLKDGTEELIINCYIISEEQMKNDPDLRGEYNVVRYIDALNKKIKPLLVVFKQEVRDTLLIDNPENKQFYTSSQLELINGLPMEEGGQDTLEELLTMSEGELLFWDKVGVNPEYMYKDRFEEVDENEENEIEYF